MSKMDRFMDYVRSYILLAVIFLVGMTLGVMWADDIQYALFSTTN